MFSVARLLVAGLLLIGAPALAQSAEVSKINIDQVGVVRLENKTIIKDADISTGQRMVSKDARVIQATTTVTGATDLNFGMIFVPTGSPRDGVAAIKVKWLYPAPGLLNPDTGTAKTFDEYGTTVTLGASSHLEWQVRAGWQIVPGTWTLQIWTASGDRLLASQDFTMVKP